KTWRFFKISNSNFLTITILSLYEKVKTHRLQNYKPDKNFDPARSKHHFHVINQRRAEGQADERMREEFGFIAIVIKLKRIFKEFFLNRSGRKFC
ncbi:unnamed protein product, partial [Larinioides sclopetarius]